MGTQNINGRDVDNMLQTRSQLQIDDLTLLPSWAGSSDRSALREIIDIVPVGGLGQFTINASLIEQLNQVIARALNHNLAVGMHLGRVGRLGALLAKRAHLDWLGRLECLYGGWLHDIGKLFIPVEILNKPGKLTQHEYEVMQRHVQFGCELLEDYPNLLNFADPVKYHHERWDGNGYPHGLVMNEIPITGRVICLVDSYDAMTSYRPYPPYQRSHREALQELDRCAGTQFDPILVNLFSAISEAEIDKATKN